MTSGAYAIINAANGMTYVGISANIDGRWKLWRSSLNGGRAENKTLQADWKCANGGGFQFVLLQVTEPDREVLIVAENRWMEHLRAASVGLYNVRSGHIGHSLHWGERRRPATEEHDATT